MKTQIRFCSIRLAAAGVAAVVLAMATPGHAGLNVPYTPDANTMHLWHFDGTFTNLDGTTNVLTPDAVVAGAVTLTNMGLPQLSTNDTIAAAAYTNISLGNPSYTGLGSALKITQRNALANGGSFSDTTSFINPVSGAFTFEAIVRPTINPLNPNGLNMEIICGDNQAGPRAWQFRIESNGHLQFQTITPGSQAYDVPLPNSGLDAAVANQWYHVALTYTGDSPTNTDTPGVLTFYWTLLDANRTYADQLGQTDMPNRPGGAPVFAVGGSGRTQTGVGNGEGFIGLIDEVRISNVALKSNEMAFSATGALNPPTFTQQPPTNTIIPYGGTLVLSPLPSGTPPINYQWQFDGGGGFTDQPGQNASTLTISNVTFSANGQYRLIAVNAYGSATSEVAQVTVGAAPSELFATGVDSNGVPLSATASGSADLHYQLIESADGSNPGLNAIIWGDGAPVAPGGLFSANGPRSGWIGPAANTGQTIGGYVYRTTFVADTLDPSTLTINGTWWLNTAGLDILLNGKSTGISDFTDTPEKFSSTFQITNGFVAGLNTLDFVVTNATGDFTALRAELSGVGTALPPGKPLIVNTNQPYDQAVRDLNLTGFLGSSASFSVVALGRPPLTYQWYSDGAPLGGATNRVLTFEDPYSGGQGSAFKVVVSNDSGSVTSRVATLTLLPTNQPPVPATFNLTTAPGQPVDLPIWQIIQNAPDADNDPVTLVYFDTASTNVVVNGYGTNNVIQNGGSITYYPPDNYIGKDQYTYTVSDGGTYAQGFVNVNVTLLQPPTAFSASLSDGNLVLSASGAPGGSYHVLSSTDLATPVSGWSAVASGTFDAAGHLSVTNAISPGVPQSYFIIQVP